MSTLKMRRTTYSGRDVKNIKLSYIGVDGKRCNAVVQAVNKTHAWTIVEGFSDFYKKDES